MTYEHYEGAKYREHRDTPVVELAKLIRADIKQAKAAGDLPDDLHVSVRYSKASMMQALDVVVRDRPDLWQQCPGQGNGSLGAGDQPCSHYAHAEGGVHLRMTVEGTRIHDVLEAIRKAYDGGEIEYVTDYFNVRYYGDTRIEDAASIRWRLEDAARKAARKQRKVVTA